MSGSAGVVRKVFDVGPASLTTSSNYDGSGSPATVWSSGVAGPSASASLWITDLSQGVTDNDRVGFSIAAESLDLSIIINPDVTLAGHSVLRILLVADNECDGAYPTLAEILGNATGTDVTIASGLPISHIQPAYFGRFHVYMDEYWDWWSTSSSGTPIILQTRTEKSLVHRRHFDLHDHRVLWDMTDASAIANARKGHLFLFFLYQNNSVATGGLNTQTTTNPPNIQFASRLRYRDA